MYSVTIKHRANNDIENITEYLVKESKNNKVALELIDNIIKNIENIAQFPNLGVNRSKNE